MGESSTTMHDDLLAPEVLADPESYFGRLREEDPVHWNEQRKMWIVTRYDDVLWVCRHPELFSSDKLAFNVKELPEAERERYRERYSLIFSTYPRWLSATDNPIHDHIRLIVNKVWTPTQSEKRRARIRTFVHELLDRAREKGRIDFIEDFAMPLPIMVILDFLGFPHEDWQQIKRWSDRWLAFHFTGGPDPQRWDAGLEGIKGLIGYAEPRVKERKALPRDDYVSALLQAEWKGDRLSEEEVTIHCANLLFSGHETTTNLLANGLYLLLRHRDQWDRLCKDPSLIPSAIEEGVRFEGTIKSTLRHASEDVEMRGKAIRKGDLVLLVNIAANRDPTKFPDPDRLDVARRPNPHIGFGQGIHVCLGAPLVRIEAHETYLALTQRFPSIRIETEHVEYQPILRGRALKALPVSIQ